MEIQDNIRNFVANANIQSALEAFSKFADGHDEDLSNQLIMLRGRYSTLRRNENLGLLTFADASRDRAQISNSILEYTTNQLLTYQVTLEVLAHLRRFATTR